MANKHPFLAVGKPIPSEPRRALPHTNPWESLAKQFKVTSLPHFSAITNRKGYNAMRRLAGLPLIPPIILFRTMRRGWKSRV